MSLDRFDLAATDTTKTDWIVEQDVDCKQMVSQAGGTLVGYDFPNATAGSDWASMKSEELPASFVRDHCSWIILTLLRNSQRSY